MSFGGARRPRQPGGMDVGGGAADERRPQIVVRLLAARLGCLGGYLMPVDIYKACIF